MSSMETLTRIVYDWGMRCFGSDQMHNRQLRALRLLEEAVECAQAAGVPQQLAALQVQRVYERPHGDLGQELGGVLLTSCAMCALLATTPEHVLEMEVRRVLAKPVEHFAARNKAKLEMGLDA